MTNRLIFGNLNGEQVLRMARAGYNVLSPGLTADQLVFDSRWSYLGKVWMKGAVPFSTSPMTIYYGRDFVRPPIVVTYSMRPAPYGGFFYEEWGYEYHSFTNSSLTLRMDGIMTGTVYYFVLET